MIVGGEEVYEVFGCFYFGIHVWKLMVLINGRLYVDCGRQPLLLTRFGKGKVNHSSMFSLIRLINNK